MIKVIATAITDTIAVCLVIFSRFDLEKKLGPNHTAKKISTTINMMYTIYWYKSIFLIVLDRTLQYLLCVYFSVSKFSGFYAVMQYDNPVADRHHLRQFR